MILLIAPWVYVTMLFPCLAFFMLILLVINVLILHFELALQLINSNYS